MSPPDVWSYSGGSRIFGRDVQVHAGRLPHYYIVPGKGGGSTLALVMQNIVEALYFYAEAAKQSIIIICTKHGNFH